MNTGDTSRKSYGVPGFQTGVTLIELMVGVAIIGILGAALASLVRAYADFDVRERSRLHALILAENQLAKLSAPGAVPPPSVGWVLSPGASDHFLRDLQIVHRVTMSPLGAGLRVLSIEVRWHDVRDGRIELETVVRP